MIETVEETIGKHRFQITQLPGLVSLRVFTRLVKLLGPSIGTVVNSDAELANLLDQDVGKLGTAIATLCVDLDVDEVESLARVFAKYSKVEVGGEDGFAEMGDVIFNATFKGDIGSLLLWFGACVRVNYSSFLDVLGATVAPASEDQE